MSRFRTVEYPQKSWLENSSQEICGNLTNSRELYFRFSKKSSRFSPSNAHLSKIYRHLSGINNRQSNFHNRLSKINGCINEIYNRKNLSNNHLSVSNLNLSRSNHRWSVSNLNLTRSNHCLNRPNHQQLTIYNSRFTHNGQYLWRLNRFQASYRSNLIQSRLNLFVSSCIFTSTSEQLRTKKN